ncbi:MAG: hypothetical protein ACTSYO_00945, partial [Candidatus Ranarchaeia archaeon]
MERIVEELKKIEQDANNILEDAKQRSDDLIKISMEKAQILVHDAETSAEDKAKKLWRSFEAEIEKIHARYQEQARIKLKTFR